MSSGINTKSSGFSDLYRDWFAAFTGRGRKLTMIGTAAVLWVICKTRISHAFKGLDQGGPTNVILIACHFLYTSMKLQKAMLPKSENLSYA